MANAAPVSGGGFWGTDARPTGASGRSPSPSSDAACRIDVPQNGVA